jgi:hypothetical protein
MPYMAGDMTKLQPLTVLIAAPRGFCAGAEAAQAVDDEAVVDDLVADIDRRPEPLDRQLDDLDGAVDACAKSARGRDQDLKGWASCHVAGDVSHRLQPW